MIALELSDLIILTRETHDRVLLAGQIPGEAPDKSLESILSRPYNKLHYGLMNDVYDYAASVCSSIVCGHAFNDGNKRTGFAVMAVILELNEIELIGDPIELADIIVQVAMGMIDSDDLAAILRYR